MSVPRRRNQRSVVRPRNPHMRVADAIIQIASGLQELSEAFVEMQKHGQLPREYREMAMVIRTPLSDAVSGFQRAAYPDSPDKVEVHVPH